MMQDLDESEMNRNTSNNKKLPNVPYDGPFGGGSALYVTAS